MTDPDAYAKFRRNSTIMFRVCVVGLFLFAAALLPLGWWLGRWCGLAGGAVLGIVVLAGGLVGGGLIYAMTQDSA